MVNCLLIGGPYAGFKTRVPVGMKMLNINDGNEISLGRSVTQLRKGLEREGAQKGTMYALEMCVITSPTVNDVMSLCLGFPPGEKMSDSFMQVITAYCMMCRPDDFLEDDTNVAQIPVGDGNAIDDGA